MTKFLILPFAGAFLTLEFAQHIMHGAMGLYRIFSKILTPKPKFIAVLDSEVPANPIPEPIVDPDPDFDFWDESVTIVPSEVVIVVKEIATSTPVSEHGGPHLVTLPAILILGIIILGLIHWPAFRNVVWEMMKVFGRIVRALCYTLPIAIWNSAAFRAFRAGP